MTIVRILRQHPRDLQALPLAAGEIRPAFAQAMLVAALALHDRLVYRASRAARITSKSSMELSHILMLSAIVSSKRMTS